MRILVLSTDPGVPWDGHKGASVHLREISAALADDGHDVLALVAGGGAGAAPSALAVEPLLCGVGAAERLESGTATAVRILAWLCEFRADAVYERLALYSGAGSAAARAVGVPHLVELNAPLPAEARRYRRLEHPETAMAIERTVLRDASAVFAVSPPLARYAAARGAARVQLLPNAVDPGRFPRPAGQRRGRAVAIFAGRIRPWHGIDAVIRTWELLGEKAPRLRILGDPGPAGPALARAGGELLGVVDHRDAPGLLCDADIGLAPYAAGAPDYFSPLKVFEYMAAGLAIVASEIPGVRAAAGDDAGVLVPGAAPEAFAAAVRGLGSDRDRRVALGAAARARVLERHTWRHRARQVVAAIPARMEVAS